jgi:hypothetical protein
MRCEPRYDRNKQLYFSFVFEHPLSGKKIRLKKEETPIFRKRDEAEAWARTQNGEHAALKDAAKQREEWRTKYHSFKDCSQNFIAWQKEKAPNSWQRSVILIEKYVFHYFLNIQEANTASLEIPYERYCLARPFSFHRY